MGYFIEVLRRNSENLSTPLKTELHKMTHKEKICRHKYRVDMTQTFPQRFLLGGGGSTLVLHSY